MLSDEAVPFTCSVSSPAPPFTLIRSVPEPKSTKMLSLPSPALSARSLEGGAKLTLSNPFVPPSSIVVSPPPPSTTSIVWPRPVASLNTRCVAELLSITGARLSNVTTLPPPKSTLPAPGPVAL